MAKRYYITTPIYYVNDVPHIGTALTTLAADVIARYQKMRGRDVHFLTGTDENAIKVAEAAKAAGRSTDEFVDEMAADFKRIWSGLNIRYDDFVRTTEERHVRAAQEAFTRLRDAGHLYLGEYEGWYDVSSETFYKESDLVAGRSPEGNEVRYVKEPNYFFRLSAFQDRLLEHIDKNHDFIVPEVRRNEVVSFIKQGLRDACVTRANPSWGIPVPGDETKVIYVWFEALLNYISAVGWPSGDWRSFWPAEVEWMGKDILVRFHATLWPAMLMGLDLPLPKTLVGHAWVLMGQEKISKSKGNVVRPLDLARDLSSRSGCSEDVAIDAVRYYMARTMPFETDSTFTHEDFDLKYNSELVNDLSNGVHRVISMLHNFCSGVIADGRLDEAVVKETVADVDRFCSAMDRFRIDEATTSIHAVTGRINGYIDREKPWDLNKYNDPRLADVMRTLAWLVGVVEGLCRPITPALADRIADLLKRPGATSWDNVADRDSIPPNHAAGKPQAIYPRLEKKDIGEKREETHGREKGGRFAQPKRKR